ncbi:hypothetical protein CROQUDRAFT_700693 [Cronartium quercuum f. sp. fusiforme G11]|uniref:Uncharacterized protein n=1 Tax=Cronartium quercuum f. sp. fusiforme G11 TaxID=708437 RepID=A0A9P6N7R1_9BASI|nr:hypothetical protein CROQUDRAFT_700693 [Cronartium quercuum f. sp. fusiforme G11]
MPPTRITHQGTLNLTLTLPDAIPKASSSASQSKKRKPVLFLHTTYSVLYSDGRLECYPGDPFSVDSKFEGSKSTRTLYLSPATGWTIVGPVPDDAPPLLDQTLSFAIRRKLPIANKSSLRQLGLDFELNMSTTPNAREPKDRKTFKDLLGLRSKRSKSIGAGRALSSQSINTLESIPPPLPHWSSDRIGDSPTKMTLFRTYSLTPEDHQFNDSLPDPLIFSVESIAARTTWMNAFDKVFVIEPSLSPDHVRKAELARLMEVSDTFLTKNSSSSPHLSLTLHSSPLVSHVLESGSKSHPLKQSPSISSLIAYNGLARENYGSQPTFSSSDAGSEIVRSKDETSSTRMAVSSSLASPFGGTQKLSVPQESASAVPAWIKSVRNADEQKNELQLLVNLSNQKSSARSRGPSSGRSASTVSSQASLPMSQSLSAPNQSGTMAEKRATFGNGGPKFGTINQLRTIGHSVVANLKRPGTSHEPPGVQDDSSSKSSGPVPSTHAHSFDTNSTDAGETEAQTGREKTLRFLKLHKKRNSVADNPNGSSPSQPSLSSSVFSKNSASGPRSNFDMTASESAAFFTPSPHRVQSAHESLVRDQPHLHSARPPGIPVDTAKLGADSYSTYPSPASLQSYSLVKTPHSKKSFTDWLSTAAAQAAEELESTNHYSGNPSNTILPQAARDRRLAERASSEASWLPLDAPEHLLSPSDRSPATTPSDDGPDLSRLSSSCSSADAHALRKPIPDLDASGERWVPNHIISPHQLIQTVQHVDQRPTEVCTARPSTSGDDFLKSLDEIQDVYPSSICQQTRKLSLAPLPLAEPGPSWPMPRRAPPVPAVVPHTSLPVPSRRRRRQNSLNSAPSNACLSSASTSLPRRLRAQANEPMRQPQSSTAESTNPASDVSQEDRPVSAGEERKTKVTGPGNDLVSILGDDFGEVVVPSTGKESHALFRRGSQSTVRGL